MSYSSMLRVAATALLCISASLASDPSSFDAYVQRFGKSYSSDVERDARRFIFQNNIREISRLNAAAITAGSSHHPAVFEVNEFADLTPEEFQTKRGMSKAELAENLVLRRAKFGGGVWKRDTSSSSPTATPDHQDWYLKATTPVRDQGQCGELFFFFSLLHIIAYTSLFFFFSFFFLDTPPKVLAGHSQRWSKSNRTGTSPERVDGRRHKN